MIERPTTRVDCENGMRPCPWVGCRYHLYLDVDKRGRISFNHANSLFSPDELDDPDLVNIILKKTATDEFSQNQDRIIFDSIQRIQYRNLIQEREKLSTRLKKCEEDEPWKLNELLVNKMVLDRKIEDLKVVKDVGYTE